MVPSWQGRREGGKGKAGKGHGQAQGTNVPGIKWGKGKAQWVKNSKEPNQAKGVRQWYVKVKAMAWVVVKEEWQAVVGNGTKMGRQEGVPATRHRSWEEQVVR